MTNATMNKTNETKIEINALDKDPNLGTKIIFKNTDNNANET